MKKSRATDREGGFTVVDIARYLGTSATYVERVAIASGVRLRMVWAREGMRRIGPLTVEETRAVLTAWHARSRRGGPPRRSAK